VVSMRVGATPLRAFEVFTAEIGEWWRPDPLFVLTPRGDGYLRFEPGEGGRLVATLANGKEFEVGRITVWKPGERLALTWRQATFAPEKAERGRYKVARTYRTQRARCSRMICRPPKKSKTRRDIFGGREKENIASGPSLAQIANRLPPLKGAQF